LLFERGYENRFNRTITVYSREEKALSRLEKQGIKRQETLQRLKSQLPIEEKIRRSDFIIDNNRSIKETNRQVKAIYQELLKEGKDGHHHRY
jgi:dephospho-CoA kinase